jgi:hypothetical protein
VFLDGDLDLPPEQLPTFLEAFRMTEVDALVGAKRNAMQSGRYPFLRRLLSVVFAAVNRVLFRLPIRETQTGLKAFKRAALETTLPALQTEGYAFDLELLVRIRKQGGSMAEHPVVLAEGAAGSVTLTMLAAMARDTLRTWIRSFRW